MKCEFCFSDIPDNSNFCTICGRPTNKFEDEKKDVEITATMPEGTPIKDPRISYALIFGIVSVVLGFFLSGIFSIVAIGFGVIAIYNGIKLIKTPAKNKAVLGATFGLLGSIFGIIAIVQMVIVFVTFNNINQKYEEQFQLTLPAKEPDAFVFYFAQEKDHPFNINQFHYELDDEEYDDVLGNHNWYPVTGSPVPNYIISEYGLDVKDSYYVYITDMESGFLVPDLEEQKNFEFTIIIIDVGNRILSIYEIWK